MKDTNRGKCFNSLATFVVKLKHERKQNDNPPETPVYGPLSQRQDQVKSARSAAKSKSSTALIPKIYPAKMPKPLPEISR